MASKTNKLGHKRIWIIMIILLLLAAGLYGLFNRKTNDTDYLIGAGVKTGSLDDDDSGNTDPSSNGKSSMRVKLNGKPIFADGKSEGSLNIENPAENELYMQVEIKLNQTGDIVYSSGAIPPNHYIDKDMLSKVLRKGEYEATAYVTLFDQDNPDTIYNSANFKLIITVLN